MTEIEKLYSEAFEDGIDYAIEKMFGEENKDQKDIKPGSENKEGFFKKAGTWIKDKYWEAGKGKGFLGLMDEVPATEAGKEASKKLNWGRLGKRVGVPAVVAAVPTALAIRSHNKKKREAAEAEKNYSEGFEDGVEYAQRMYGIGDKIARKFRKFIGNQTVNDRILDFKDKAVDKWNKLSKLQKAGVIAGGTAAVGVPTALAIRSHNKKKREAAEAED